MFILKILKLIKYILTILVILVKKEVTLELNALSSTGSPNFSAISKQAHIYVLIKQLLNAHTLVQMKLIGCVMKEQAFRQLFFFFVSKTTTNSYYKDFYITYFEKCTHGKEIC